MNLSQIEYFAKAAEALSFSRAAEELYVTQQAVSKAVANLEEELGCRLFERAAGGLVLTQDGQVARARAQAVLRDVRSLAEGVGRASQGNARTLRLAVADVVVGEQYYVSLDRVLEFSKAHPAWRLDVVEMPSDACLDLLAAGDADVAVVSSWSNDARFVARLLRSDACVPFVARGHRLAKRDRVSPADLVDELFLIPRGSSSSVDELCEGFYTAGVDVPAREQFALPDCTPRLLIDRVCHGDGVGFIGERATGFVGRAGGVVLRVDPNPFTLRLTACARRPLVAGSGAALLRDYLVGLFRGRGRS